MGNTNSIINIFFASFFQKKDFQMSISRYAKQSKNYAALSVDKFGVHYKQLVVLLNKF
jgi:hypothetical protein